MNLLGLTVGPIGPFGPFGPNIYAIPELTKTNPLNNRIVANNLSAVYIINRHAIRFHCKIFEQQEFHYFYCSHHFDSRILPLLEIEIEHQGLYGTRNL